MNKYMGIIRESIEVFGEESQFDQTIEELSELIQAISKYKRAKRKGDNLI